MKVRGHIPNAITSLNLLCGVVGVVFALSGRPDIAFYLMLAAAVCDFCDGFAARLLRAYSPVGKELDSLADMVSFGVLPSVMLYDLMHSAGNALWLSLTPLLLAVSSGLRLAKFNVDERQHTSFLGLPTPACAMACGSIAAFCHFKPLSPFTALCSGVWFIPAVTLALCILLVCELPMFSFKSGSECSNIEGMKRTAFSCIAVPVIVIVAVLGLNWTMAVLGTIAAYILENLIFAAFRIRG